MFDIVSIISKHTAFLEDQLKQINANQRKSIAIAFAQFYFLLPDVTECLEEHLNVKITKEQFIADLKNDNLQYLKEALQKYDNDIDPYSEDFVELEPIEINILSGLENCIYNPEKPQNAPSNFLLIIDILDYYENFSDNPEYWNKLLEEEIQFQREITERMANGEIPEENLYYERYKNVDFVL
ncbi:hypothetical protein [Flavobacterium quisquiliarum]|jgi:hypothetical protein|uniref:Uncharacterized protein n=1 Tax=Flavobacterium quisquiliarum TaxID=1834436 RepID=A0ABV8W9Z8_9FLAO|nr:hypothetical protein [Flavobacterium quisquiliarum]MBW1657949.1 hypothetical protein [Flavobacterium quisquiliarum]NWL01007.1 hypothetical protein [Flavobacterium collinsii]